MTTTAIRVDTDAWPVATTATPSAPADHPTTPTIPAPHDRLLATLRAALAACADLDPDALGSRTPAGRAAVALAGTARAAVAALGGDAGPALTHAPGIVVARDLAMATSLLDATARRSGAATAAGARLADLAAEAERRLADLLRVVTPRG